MVRTYMEFGIVSADGSQTLETGTENTVVIQHIVTADTIDERILKALEQKDNTQSALIDAVKAEVSGHGN